MTWLRSQYAEADVVTNWQALKKLRLLAEQERSDAGAGGAGAGPGRVHPSNVPGEDMLRFTTR